MPSSLRNPGFWGRWEIRRGKKPRCGSGSWIYVQLITNVLFSYRVIFLSRKELQLWGLEQTAWFWLNAMRGECTCSPLWLAVCNFHTFIVQSKCRHWLRGGAQSRLHASLLLAVSFSHGLLLGVLGRCSSMPQSLPWPLTELEPLLNQSKYSAPRRCRRTFITCTLKQQPAVWALIYGGVIILGSVDCVSLMDWLQKGGQFSEQEVNNAPSNSSMLCWNQRALLGKIPALIGTQTS